MTTALRTRVENGFGQFGNLVYRRAWIVLLFMLCLILGLVSRIPGLKMDTSTEGFLHPEDPTLIAYDRFREQYGRDELILLTIKTPDLFTPEALDRLNRLHQALREKTPYLDDITSLINARNTRGAEGELIVEDLLERWPETEQAREEVRERALANPLYRNMLISDDGTITTIVIKTDAYPGKGTSEDVMAGFEDEMQPDAAAPEAERVPLSDAQNSEVVEVVRDIAAGFDSDQFRIHLAGSPVVTDVLKRSMVTNMKRFMLLSLAIISLLLFLLFRRLSGVFLPVVIVLLSLLSTLGLMALAGVPFKLPTQIMPSFLLAVGVGASVHLLAVFYRRLQLQAADSGLPQQASEAKRLGIVYALGHSGLAIVMTSLTTAAGLASFAGAQVAPVSDLGIVAAAGVIISLIYTLVLLPALLSIIPLKPQHGEREKKRHERFDRLMITIADISTTRPKPVLVVSALVLAVGMAGALQVRFSHKPAEWLPLSNPARIATDFVNDNMRGASTVEVVVDTGRENGLYEPDFMQGLARLNREIATIDQGELYVGKTLSLADVLKEINQALNENRLSHYRIPDRRDLIAQEFLLFENSGSDDLEDFVDSQFRQTRFTIKMPWVDSVLYGPFMEELKQRFLAVLGDANDIFVTGMVALLGRTMSATIESMKQSYLIAILVISLMMILLIGNIRIGLISMIPNLAPIILTLGLMGWFGIPIDLFTMLIGSIAIGLAVDDTIHFMHNYRRYHHDTGDVREAVRNTLLTTGRAMLVTTVVLSSGFFLYMFATLSNLSNFGLLTGFTIIMALLADFFLAPALLAQLHRSHLIADDSDY
ncbi:MAG: MMPL family transporter [Gammaproteobacteria bacterium]|nr:MMPL family transporter [Gammaproteobacteria bacterium]